MMAVQAQDRIDERLRAFDWVALGMESPARWPAPLRSALSICIGSKVPTAIYAGPEMRVLFNDAWAALMEGATVDLGCTARTLWGDAWDALEPRIRRVLDQGDGFIADARISHGGHDVGGDEKLWSHSFSPIAGDDGTIVGIFDQAHACTTNGAVEQEIRSHSIQQEFLITLGDCIQNAGNPHDVTAIASELLGRHLHADRAGYALIEDGGDFFLVDSDWGAPGMSSLAGRHALEAFGSPLISMLRSGRTVAIDDVLDCPLTCGPGVVEAYRSAETRAAITVPLIRSGRFAAALYVHSRHPRHWTPQEQHLAEQVARRTWGSVERARVDVSLRSSEHFVRAVLENLFALVGVTTPDGTLIAANSALLRATGLARAEIIGRALWESACPDHASEANRALRAAFADARNGSMQRFDLMTNAPDGSLYWLDFQLAPMRDERGEVSHLILSAVDITERKVAERNARFLAEAGSVLAGTLDYQQTLASIAKLAIRDIADVFIVDMVDEHGQLRRIEVACRDASLQASCDALQHDASVRGRADLALSMLESDKPALLAHVSAEDVSRMGQSEAHLKALRELDPKSIIAAPLLTRDTLVGALVFVSCSTPFTRADLQLATDLAERAALAIENARLYRAAAQATRARDEMLGVVAHDLRSPLSTIYMQAMLMRQQASEQKHPLANAADVIERAVGHMNRLIQDLMDVTRIEAGRLTIEPCAVGVQTLLAEFAQAQAPIAAERAVDLRIESAPGLGAVLADRDRLIQVLENLVGNALQSMSAGGTVTVGATPGAGVVTFRVADSGSGISPEQIPFLFDRFWQARTTGKQGAGLGLPIVKGIIEAHGGRIWVESVIGVGSTFHFTLPVAR